MSAFDRLHPHLRHAIVHDLGWRALRPVQDLTIDVVLDGSNTVVLAPTAGGKTEAALFPVLSTILTSEAPPVAALYVCPIRALLNNQEPRVRRYAQMVGLDAFKWHGDVGESKRARFRRSPSHVLMTTPESLEVMLISEKTDSEALFRHLQFVIVDEIHAFAGDDRGAHLVSILERLVRFCRRDLQRIGLSATVGNPDEIGRWLRGSSERPFQLVDPPQPPAQRSLHIDHVESIDEAALGIARIGREKKSLVFVESRSQAERVARALQGRGVEVFVHHSAVSRADRTLAEERFAEGGSNAAIVCTSTMELGIDVGDLDHVLQVDTPGSVASFLQRLGRTGRREATVSNCAFFCLRPDLLLQAVAVARLAHDGWVEDVRPSRRAYHVLAHQILALGLQEGGISRHRILDWLSQATPYADIAEDDLQLLVETMLERDILYESDGVLSLGQQGEKLYGRMNFFDLYAVFSSPPVFHVLHGKAPVGTIQADFVQGHDPQSGPMLFRLAGRPWAVTHIDWDHATLHVVPGDEGKVPSWRGFPCLLSFAICQEMKRSLLEPGPESDWLSRSAALELDDLRSAYDGLFDGEAAPLEDVDQGVQWHTFAGGAINRLLAKGLERVTGEHWVSGNLSLTCKEMGRVAARQAIRELTALDWSELAIEAARPLARGRISKFQPCLPEQMENRLLVDRLLDVEGLSRFLERLEFAPQEVGGHPK